MKGVFEKRAFQLNVQFLFICLLLVTSSPVTAADNCPQKRTTPTAPQVFLKLKNPVPLNDKTLKAGEKIFQLQGKPITCKTCHGEKGDGIAESGFESTPPPRNFTCAETMEALPDGQLFWIIRNGSPKTSMFAFPSLSDEQVWQLIHYIRQFSQK
ncbi:MAG: c-type cytochrome [Nitrospinota bacterium]|nr:c-type cytochrome [Nitrospinota bacterium]